MTQGNVVQDAFSRLLATRLCLDQIRSARSRREHPHDASEIEFVPGYHPTAGMEAPAAACSSGDLDGLLGLRTPDAWGELDAGPGQRGPRGVVHGALPVARILLHHWGPGTTLVTQPVAGQPALLGFADRRLFGVIVFTVRGNRIQAVHVISDPRQFSFISAQLATVARPAEEDQS
jgi:hypothetical protein